MITKEDTHHTTTNVLVAVDSGPAAVAALAWASELVRHKRESGDPVKATLITVIEPDIRMEVDGLGFPDYNALTNSANHLLDDLRDQEPNAAEFDTVVKSGSAAEIILAEARALESDLIVVGTRHEGPVRQALLGSVSQALAACRERPVAVVPAEYTALSERAVVGYDGSPGSRAAIRWALTNCEGKVRVVQVVSTADELIDAHEALASLIPAIGQQAVGRILAEAVVGDPIEVLTSDDRQTPQIVVGARSHRTGKDELWGSTTTKLLANTERPVVVVPPEPWSD